MKLIWCCKPVINCNKKELFDLIKRYIFDMLGHFVIQIFQMIPVFLFKNRKFHQYVQAAVCSLVTKKCVFLPCTTLLLNLPLQQVPYWVFLIGLYFWVFFNLKILDITHFLLYWRFSLYMIYILPPIWIYVIIFISDSQCFHHSLQFSSVQFSCSVVSDSLRLRESQHARSPCPSTTSGVHSDSHPSSQWCHPAISFSVVPFSFCP